MGVVQGEVVEIPSSVSLTKSSISTCPVCGHEFDYIKPLCGQNGPWGAVEVIVTGYYGSKHDYGQRKTYICDHCVQLVFALLNIFDMNNDWGIEAYRDECGFVIPEAEKLTRLRDWLMPKLRNFIESKR